MIKPILKNSMTLFEQLGTVKSRSMFGGFGIFVDDTMFALVVGETLHIRGNDESTERFKNLGFAPYVYKKRGFPVVTKYYALPNEYWNDLDTILAEGKIALDAASSIKSQQSNTKPNRIKDLPNLRLATERMLKKAGIDSVENLIKAGSLAAYKAISDTNNTQPKVELLWALEGAIEGTHWSVVSQERRQELLNQLN